MKIDAIWQAPFQQQVFRQLVSAQSRPGTVATMPDCQVEKAILAALVDQESSLADPDNLLTERDWQRLGVRREQPEAAAFVVLDGDRQPTFEPRLGTLASPEFGATLILKIQALTGGEVTYRLTGPGVKGGGEFAPAGLNPAWLDKRDDWNGQFPLGVDFILCAGDSFLALPRTTQVTAICTTNGHECTGFRVS
ncbi:MAG: phosphonate C-P lyase system protein PhnH [Methylococcales bacterium]|nr:phosphonate C-P lyase system protein PhnH [Methylococcales bacterium]